MATASRSKVKKKKKSAWSATYWENNEERDVEGYEMRMPDGMPIPQLKGDERYKYLGTELRTGWANGEGQTEMTNEGVVRRGLQEAIDRGAEPAVAVTCGSTTPRRLCL